LYVDLFIEDIYVIENLNITMFLFISIS